MTDTDTTRAEVERAMPAAGLSLVSMPTAEFERMKGIANALGKSGVFKDTAPAVVFAKMVIGRELGLGIGQSMLGLHVLPDGIQMHYSTILASVRARGWKYRITEHTEEKNVIEWIDTDGVLVGTSEFTMEEAKHAGLTRPGKNGSRSMYDKVPKNMLLARNVSNGVKAYVPEAMAGMPIYVSGELPQPYVDGSVEDLPNGMHATTDDVLDDVVERLIPEDQRERFRDAYTVAAELRPGMLTVAAIEMSLTFQPPERVAQYIDEIELANIAAAQKRDEAVGVADAEEVPPEEVEALLRRLSDLMEQRDNTDDLTEAQEAEIDQEIDQLESAIKAKGGALPGEPGPEQEAMDLG